MSEESKQTLQAPTNLCCQAAEAVELAGPHLSFALIVDGVAVGLEAAVMEILVRVDT